MCYFKDIYTSNDTWHLTMSGKVSLIKHRFVFTMRMYFIDVIILLDKQVVMTLSFTNKHKILEKLWVVMVLKIKYILN